MDVTLALNHIRIRQGLQGYKRKSSMFCLQTDVVGLSVLSTMKLNTVNGKPNFSGSLLTEREELSAIC